MNLCVEKIASRPRGNLCVEKITSPPRRILCVDKIGSRAKPYKRYIAHFLFENRSMIVFQIGNEQIINAKCIFLNENSLFHQDRRHGLVSALKIDQ